MRPNRYQLFPALVVLPTLVAAIYHQSRTSFPHLLTQPRLTTSQLLNRFVNLINQLYVSSHPKQGLLLLEPCLRHCVRWFLETQRNHGRNSSCYLNMCSSIHCPQRDSCPSHVHQILCNMWLCNDLPTLWAMAPNCTFKPCNLQD